MEAVDRAAFAAALAHLDHDDRTERYRHDPVAWVRDKLGEHVWSKQAEIMASVVTDRLVTVQSAHGVGKALYTGTMLPTPTGWTTMADVEVGDELLDENGKPVRVIGKSEVQHRPTYRVTFDDRTELIAADDHSWQVVDLRHRPRGGVNDWRNHWAATTTKTTAELAESLTFGGQYRWRVPTCRPIEGQSLVMPVPAYTLGAWLGDGTTIQAALTCGYEDAPETLGHIEAEGVTVRPRPSAMRENSGCWGLLGMQVPLRELGVLGNKHIPERIFRADVNTRLSVLQGLMDTDGFTSSGQSVGIDLTNERLARDVAALVRTFGWKARCSNKPSTLYGRVVGTVYRLQFRPDLPVFRLRRKAERLGQAVHQTSRHTVRTVVSVELVDTMPTQCVEVDSPTHLYLAGESYVPTHNSHLASRLVLWWLDTHPPRDTMVVTSAPTAHQVASVLWRYIRHGHEKGDLPGYITQGQVPEWKIDGNLVGFGRRPADHQQSSFQGFHAKHLLIILDEAGGIPKWLWDSADSLMSGQEDQHLLAIGNPDDNSAHFARVCTTEPNWTRYRISAFDSPNYTGEAVPPELARLLVGPVYVEDKRARWGEQSPLWQVKVLGEFVDSEDGLIPLSWVRAANARWHRWRDAGAHEVGGRRIIGVDVARYGEDATCLAIREGDVIREIHTHHRMDTDQTTQLVQAQLGFPRSYAVVDVIGVGAGVLDQLRARRHSTVPFNAAMATKRRDSTGQWRFKNVRSAAWWNLRELLDPSTGATLALPDDDELTAELCAPQWAIGTGNTLVVDSKDTIRKRIKRSTDRADAVAMAMWVNPSSGRADPDESTEYPRARRPRARGVSYADGVTW